MCVQDEESQWYIDNGCSNHKVGDKRKTLSLKEVKGGSVTLGDNASTIIMGKGIVSLVNEKAKIEDVLFIEGLKHNILSLIQLFDKGHEFTFNSKGCEIIKAIS